jgi:hypothetical protein
MKTLLIYLHECVAKSECVCGKLICDLRIDRCIVSIVIATFLWSQLQLVS